MLIHAREAIALTKSRGEDACRSDRVLQLALVRLVEVIGEAASRVPPEIADENPSIRWQEIRGMRNRLIHGYDKIDLDVLWDTIRDDLPPLVKALERIVGD